MAGSSKTIQKHQHVPTRTQKGVKYYINFLINTHSSLPTSNPTPFLKVEN